MCCVVLCCIPLYTIALHWIALNCIALDCIGLHCIGLHCITCVPPHYIASYRLMIHYRIYLQTYLYNQIINHQFGSLNAIELVIVQFHSAFSVSCGVTSLRSTLFLTFFLQIDNDSFLGSTPFLLIPLPITNT